MPNKYSHNDFFTQIYDKASSLNINSLDQAANLITNTEPGKVILVGNGGSAAIASHLAIDFTKAAGVKAICLNESSLITCFANDYGYDNWCSNALEMYASPHDLLIAISSSGESPNILNSVHKATDLGMLSITLTGFLESNSLRSLGSLNLYVNSCSYNVVESVHQMWLLSMVESIVSSRASS